MQCQKRLEKIMASGPKKGQRKPNLDEIEQAKVSTRVYMIISLHISCVCNRYIWISFFNQDSFVYCPIVESKMLILCIHCVLCFPYIEFIYKSLTCGWFRLDISLNIRWCRFNRAVEIGLPGCEIKFLRMIFIICMQWWSNSTLASLINWTGHDSENKVSWNISDLQYVTKKISLHTRQQNYTSRRI